MPVKEAYLKGLNALRVICALSLVLGHTAQRDFASWDVFFIPVPECCVYVFFVISGFLAGYRIEFISSAGSYFKKKALRLLPQYFFYIAITAIVFLFLGRSSEVINPSLWYYALLVPGIPFCNHNGILPLVHLWFIGSLVLFHIVFFLFSKFKGSRITGATIIIIIWFCFKVLSRIILGKQSFVYRFSGITCFDILFLGVVGGIAYREKAGFISFLIEPSHARFFCAISWILFLTSGLYGKFIPAIIRPEFVSVLSLIMIITQQVPKIRPFLENRVFDWLSGISYEVYVCHILVIILLSTGYSHIKIALPGIIVYFVCISIIILSSWVFKHALALCSHKRIII